MPSSWTGADLVVLATLGILTPVLGLIGLLTRSRYRGQLAALCVAGLGFGLLAAGAWARQMSLVVWAPAALLAGVCGLFLVVRSSLVGHLAARLFGVLRYPAAPWAVLLVLGPTLIFAWVWWLDLPKLESWPGPGYDAAHEPVLLHRVRTATAVTDAGRTVPLYLPAHLAAPEWVQSAENYLLNARNLEEHLIRTDRANEDYNCHGWVFANGRYWIQGDDVPHILEDNGYQPVNEPQAGDLAIYTDPDGHVEHSGIVRGSGADGAVLVESKWGKAGRFISTADSTCYLGPCTYFHSERHSPSLRGLPGQATEDAGASHPQLQDHPVSLAAPHERTLPLE